jgi:5'-methylthioadenosine phosphorylase
MAHITDYDVWHVSAAPVTVEMVIRTLNQNTQAAQQAIRHLAGAMDETRNCQCGQALAEALITNKERVPPATRQKLDLLVGKYLK